MSCFKCGFHKNTSRKPRPLWAWVIDKRAEERFNAMAQLKPNELEEIRAGAYTAGVERDYKADVRRLLQHIEAVGADERTKQYDACEYCNMLKSNTPYEVVVLKMREHHAHQNTTD
jgi:hypothetical protein